MKKFFFLFLVITFSSCQEDYSDKSKMLGNDYGLFWGTPVWELAKAVKNNNIEKIEELGKAVKSDIDYPETKFGQTLLFLTIANQQFKACSQLLSLGANPNVHDNYANTTPLIEAAKIQDADLSIQFMKALVEHGANINEEQKGFSYSGDSKIPANYTPLIIACKDVFTSSKPFLKVKFLVETGAKVSLDDSLNSVTALGSSITFDHDDIALYLLLHGAKTNCTSILLYEGKMTKYSIIDELKVQTFDIGTEEYKSKMKVVEFLKTKGIDYFKYPIPKNIIELIKEQHPNDWEEYLKKY
jgi:ankyrin repeat protein